MNIRNLLLNAEIYLTSLGLRKEEKKQENIWKVKMTEEDLQLCKNICLVPQVGYSSRICTKWDKCETLKRKREEQHQKVKDDAMQHESTFFFEIKHRFFR